jgi:hypothetical protein
LVRPVCYERILLAERQLTRHMFGSIVRLIEIPLIETSRYYPNGVCRIACGSDGKMEILGPSTFHMASEASGCLYLSAIGEAHSVLGTLIKRLFTMPTTLILRP